jgi:hypothetical protein
VLSSKSAVHSDLTCDLSSFLSTSVDMEYHLKNIEMDSLKMLERKCMDISGKLSDFNEALKMYNKRADKLQGLLLLFDH